jgi:hypothetical protein
MKSFREFSLQIAEAYRVGVDKWSNGLSQAEVGAALAHFKAKGGKITKSEKSEKKDSKYKEDSIIEVREIYKNESLEEIQDLIKEVESYEMEDSNLYKGLKELEAKKRSQLISKNPPPGYEPKNNLLSKDSPLTELDPEQVKCVSEVLEKIRKRFWKLNRKVSKYEAEIFIKKGLEVYLEKKKKENKRPSGKEVSEIKRRIFLGIKRM